MLITDKKVLEILDLLKSLNKVRFDVDFCEAIGLKKQNLIKIRNQDLSKKNNHFTAEQLLKLSQIYNVDMNYIFGISTDPFRKLTSTKTSTLKSKTTKSIELFN